MPSKKKARGKARKTVKAENEEKMQAAVCDGAKEATSASQQQEGELPEEKRSLFPQIYS
jgi:hypothetical protein